MAVRAASLSGFQIASVKRTANSKHMLPGRPHPRCASLVGAPFSKEPEYQNQAWGSRRQSRWREAHRPHSLPGQGSVGSAVLKHLRLTFSINTRRNGKTAFLTWGCAHFLCLFINRKIQSFRKKNIHSAQWCVGLYRKTNESLWKM